jgi:hypothetical protein
MSKEIWIIKSNTGEYQFSDGPVGERSISADYTNLEQGLAEHSGCIIHWPEDNQ